jgi:DDE superfamily endonuclease
MTSRISQLMDLYSDYLIVSFGQTSATGMARLMPELSHDQVTRFLAGKEFDNKDLWKIVKPQVRQIQCDDAVLIFDDSIEEKHYSDESELICWHWDHTVNRNVKGINLLSGLYYSKGVSLPISLHFVLKTERVTDKKTGKEKWASPISKNEVMRQMITSTIERQIPFRYILADSWFSSDENMEFIKLKAKKDFIIPLKENRNIYFESASKNKRDAMKITDLEFKTDEIKKLWLEGLSFPVHVCRQVFKNEDSSDKTLYLCTSDLDLSASQLCSLYQKRWKVEEYHKSIKSNTSFAKSPARRPSSQINHLFCSIVAYVKLEVARRGMGKNHFAQKAQLYQAALVSALEKLRSVNATLPKLAITL